MAKTKIEFYLAPEIVGEATSGMLLGEFNDWDFEKGFLLKLQKDGSMTASISLEEGKKYEYRYYLNDGRWVNDGNADGYVYVSYYQIDNCIIKVPTSPKPTAAKAEVKTKAAPKTKAAAKPKAAAKTKADDLTKIEGIGKKIAELLKADGIDTFTALSKATLKTLKGVLETAGPRYNIHDPKTWAKQAKLAAADKWDELKAWQEELNGGK